jgi:hypothetical protein
MEKLLEGFVDAGLHFRWAFAEQVLEQILIFPGVVGTAPVGRS